MFKNKNQNEVDNDDTNFDNKSDLQQKPMKKKSIFEVPSLLYKSFFIAALSCAVWFSYFYDYLQMFIITLSIAIIGCFSSWFFARRLPNGELYLSKIVVVSSLIIKIPYIVFFLWFNLSIISKVVPGEDERIRFCAATFAVIFLIMCVIGIIKTIKVLIGTTGNSKSKITALDFNW